MHRALRAVRGLAAAAVFSIPVATAQPPLTPIEDILYKADGTRFNGQLEIQWKSFEAADTSNIATHQLNVRIVNGLLRVRLVPTTNATPGAHYVVRYVSDGRIQFTEYWGVPPSTAAVRVREVRLAAAPGIVVSPSGSTTIQITDVAGLVNELEIRPVKGLNYTTSRAAIINASGEIEGAAGAAEECVRVDGSSGPCGSGGGGGPAATFVDGESPGGAIDGSNNTFTLVNTPSPAGSLELYRNGLLQKSGLDFSITGSTITFLTGATPQPGDMLLAFYRVQPPAGQSFVSVLCSGSGSATSGTTPTSLGSCLVPANTLVPGDRVEIALDFSHEGAATGFAFEIRWGSTTVATRTAPAGEALATVRVHSAIGNPTNYLSFESWGTTLAQAVGATTSAPDLTQPLTIDLLGRMTSATSETVTLRGYRVVRFGTSQ
jgi:hypothetical protein